MGRIGRVAISALCVASSVALGVACDGARSSGGSVGGFGGLSSITDAGADAADASATPLSLAFDQTDTLTLNPKEKHEFVVRAMPPGAYPVRFALLGSGVGDAALDASEVPTDDSGVARVTLTAPSTPTTFTIRASVTRAQTQLGVSVSARNYTSLTVLPSYSGKRPISEWTATAAAGVSCASLSGNPPPDGDLSTTAAFGKAPVLAKVPVGVALAVTLRAGHYVGGCADQPALSESDGNQVLVYASDRPLNLGDTTLELSFGPTTPSAALSQLMSSTTSEMTNTVTAGATSDVTALLDAMQLSTLSANRDSFSAARQMYTWDSALASAFGANAATRLRDPLTRWLTAGLAGFYATDTFQGTLTARGSGASFAPERVASVSADAAGLTSSVSGTWSADSSDTLLLGLTLAWQPAQLLAALALPPAIQEFPDATSVDDALGASVDCGLVGRTLAAHGPAASLAYAGCDDACVSSACTQAMTTLWQNASAASGATTAKLAVTGTGSASVADDAAIGKLDGSWVGQLVIGAQSANAGGPLRGTTPGN